MELIKYWVDNHQPVTTIGIDTKAFTLNVLAAAIFKQELSIRKRRIQVDIIQIFVFGEQGLKAWWTPRSWRNAAVAIEVFRSYILGLINEERELLFRGVEHNQHLVAALVCACEVDKRSQPLQPGRNTTLTETEIVSNLFVYAFAGNDTAAIVLGHILVDLATHHESQDWTVEQIHYYLPSDDATQWEYHTLPKPHRCLAVVYEELRLDHPLNQLVKTAKNHAQSLGAGERTYTIPDGTNIHLSLSALHTHPQY